MADQPVYQLLYHPSIPGRGEFIRLAFEATGRPYTDIANSQPEGYTTVQNICMHNSSLSPNNAPIFAPPALLILPPSKPQGNSGSEPEEDSEPLLLSQTASILQHIGPSGTTPREKLQTNQLTLTALDLNNEIHDSHHPLSVSQYYEQQKDAAKLKAEDLRQNRLPKFFAHFTAVLVHNNNKQSSGSSSVSGRDESGSSKKEYAHLVGSSLTYADTTLWQILDGLHFAFPREMAFLAPKFPELLGGEDVGGFYGLLPRRERLLGEYLRSERRLGFSMGVFRKYPELDRE